MNRRHQESYWVLQAQSGDLQALDSLLRSVQASVFQYLTAIIGDASIAEDVLQESLIRACEKLKWLREPTAFRPWLFRIATRQAYRHHRMRSRRPESSSEVDVSHCEDGRPSPSENLEREEVNLLLSQSLDHVSPASRSVLSLHYLQELSLQEAADVLEVSLGTVKSRLAYGLLQLRKQLPQRANSTIAGHSSSSNREDRHVVE